MKEILLQLLSNRILLCGATGWLTAQVLKTIIHAILNRGIDWSRLIGDGGMPSGHSATVTAVATCAGLTYGFDSGLFGIAIIVAIIVMHDAMGVRLETGKQALVIKQMATYWEELGHAITDEEKLKEFVGHTPIQVVAGACLGVIVAFLYTR